MDIRSLKQNADRVLHSAAYPPRKLVLIHTGIALGVSLILALTSYMLDYGISSDGGLSGLDTQSALATAQVVLRLASAVAMHFWQAGILFAAMGYVRRRPVSPRDLSEGFHRFKPMLSSGIMMGLQYLGVGFISIYLSSAIIVSTPFGAPVYELAEMLAENPDLDITAMNMGVDGIEAFAAAYLIVFLILYAVLALPVYYRYRMVNYIIMDGGKVGGFGAMFLSSAMTRGRRFRLFKLDLSFWWFYVLEVLLNVVAMADLLLAAVRVPLPVSEGVAYWGCQLLAMAGQLVLYYLAKPKMEVTYALCYESFLRPEEPKPQKPVEHPWTY